MATSPSIVSATASSASCLRDDSMTCAPAPAYLAAIAAPILTGYIVQATHSFSGAFVAAAAFLLLGIAGYVFLLRGMEPIPEPV